MISKAIMKVRIYMCTTSQNVTFTLDYKVFHIQLQKKFTMDYTYITIWQQLLYFLGISVYVLDIQNTLSSYISRWWKTQFILQDMWKLDKRIIFKNLVIMHGKAESSKIIGNICNIPVDAESVLSIL